MKTLNDRFFYKKHDDILWAFNNRDPFLSLETKPYYHTAIVDPFPCYSHNEELVYREIEYVEKVIPLPNPPQWFILPYEGYCRTNGTATNNKDYQYDKTTDKQTETLHPYIILHGKRIPIMPNLTRYLVAHEYSHIIDYTLSHAMGIDSDELRGLYAEVRGIREIKSYGALNWHNNIGEILANDIRILFFNREGEFWPHTNVMHPMEDEIYLKVYPWLEEKFKKYFNYETLA